jgi:hypothetical protein
MNLSITKIAKKNFTEKDTNNYMVNCVGQGRSRAIGLRKLLEAKLEAAAQAALLVVAKIRIRSKVANKSQLGTVTRNLQAICRQKQRAKIKNTRILLLQV